MGQLAQAQQNKYKKASTAVMASKVKMHTDSNSKPLSHSLCHPHVHQHTNIYSTVYPLCWYHVAVKPQMEAIMLTYE